MALQVITQAAVVAPDLSPPQNAAWFLAELKAELDKRDQALRKHATAEIQAMERRILALLPQSGGTGSILESEAKKTKRACDVCGDVTVVHKHRSLGLLLDDKCRKQVDTFKQGGTITERRDAWRNTLQDVTGNNPDSLASRLLVHLGAGIPNAKKRKIEDTQTHLHGSPCNQCSICHEVIHPHLPEGAVSTDEAPFDMPCNHTFHQKCMVQWLQEKPSCPVCRTEVKLEHPVITEADSSALQEPLKQLQASSGNVSLDACSPSAALDWGEWLVGAQADTLAEQAPSGIQMHPKQIGNTSLCLKRDPSFGDNWLDFLEA